MYILYIPWSNLLSYLAVCRTVMYAPLLMSFPEEKTAGQINTRIGHEDIQSTGFNIPATHPIPTCYRRSLRTPSLDQAKLLTPTPTHLQHGPILGVYFPSTRPLLEAISRK